MWNVQFQVSKSHSKSQQSPLGMKDKQRAMVLSKMSITLNSKESKPMQAKEPKQWCSPTHGTFRLVV